jgi:hypothetical protein
MLRRSRLWNALTGDFVLHAGLGIEPHGPLASALREGHALL